MAPRELCTCCVFCSQGTGVRRALQAGVVWPASPNFLFGGTISRSDDKLGLVVQTRAGVVLFLYNLHSSD